MSSILNVNVAVDATEQKEMCADCLCWKPSNYQNFTTNFFLARLENARVIYRSVLWVYRKKLEHKLPIVPSQRVRFRRRQQWKEYQMEATRITISNEFYWNAALVSGTIPTGRCTAKCRRRSCCRWKFTSVGGSAPVCMCVLLENSLARTSEQSEIKSPTVHLLFILKCITNPWGLLDCNLWSGFYLLCCRQYIRAVDVGNSTICWTILVKVCFVSCACDSNDYQFHCFSVQLCRSGLRIIINKWLLSLTPRNFAITNINVLKERSSGSKVEVCN